jgi:hypothetical protein
MLHYLTVKLYKYVNHVMIRNSITQPIMQPTKLVDHMVTAMIFIGPCPQIGIPILFWCNKPFLNIQVATVVFRAVPSCTLVCSRKLLSWQVTLAPWCSTKSTTPRTSKASYRYRYAPKDVIVIHSWGNTLIISWNLVWKLVYCSHTLIKLFYTVIITMNGNYTCKYAHNSGEICGKRTASIAGNCPLHIGGITSPSTIADCEKR